MKIIVIKNNTYWVANNISHAESIRLIESSNINEKTASTKFYFFNIILKLNGLKGDSHFLL